MSGTSEKEASAKGVTRHEKLLFGTALVLLGLALAFSEAARFRDRGAQNALAAELQATRVDADAALSAVIPPETLSAVDRSVYMIATDRSFIGTAFVVDRDRGILATAAHVADALPLDDDNHTIRAINQFTGKALRVRIAKKHSGYGAFTRIAERYQPVDPETPIVNPRTIALSDYANDAGILIVDPIDVDTGENILGPNLPIAPEEDLYKLKAGDAIAVIGFPSDMLTSGIADKSAASRIERGVISAMVSPIDLADQSADVIGRNLIVHRMATAPGTSGGPIVNGKGQVIGVNTHGLSSPFSNGDKMGQRAEVLYDLLAALREEFQIDRIYAPDWRRRLSRWKKARDIIPYTHYYAQRLDKDPKVAELQVAGVDFDAETPFRSQVIDLKFDTTRENFTIYAADLAIPAVTQAAQTAAAGAANRLSAQTTPLFRLPQSGEFREMVFDLPADEQHVIYAFDYAVNTFYGFCPVAIHHREIGKPELILGRPSGSPGVKIEATGAKGARKRVQTVFHRPNCPTSSDFFAGVISWKPETPNVTTPATAKTADIANALFNRAACVVDGDGETCTRTLKASYEGGEAAHREASGVERLVPIVSIAAARPAAAND
ncbi:MAG: serine protease [Parvularculaceae bacterium]|nr:serine protease [Parvularculaceae bacterium]